MHHMRGINKYISSIAHTQ